MTRQEPEPLLALYPDPDLFRRALEEVRVQQAMALQAAKSRRDWLGWVGWTSALFPAVQYERKELRNLQDLSRRLEAARLVLGRPRAVPNAAPPPAGDELFTGCELLPDGAAALHAADGEWILTDGKRLWKSGAEAAAGSAPAGLSRALAGVLAARLKELRAEVAAHEDDLRRLASERASLEKDLADYQALYNAHGPDYEVDYGTSTMSAASALLRTQTDLDQNRKDQEQTAAERSRLAESAARIDTARERFGK
jgi:hypothetical protein